MSEERFDRILAAEQRMREGLAWFRRFESHSWEDVEEFVTAAIRGEGEQQILFAFIQDEIRAGVPCPAASPDLKTRLRVHFRQGFHTDPLSDMGAIVVPNEGQRDLSWKVFETDPLMANFTEGQFGRVSGPPGMGKTTLACVQIERWIRRGFLAFTNIRIKDSGIVFTPDVRSLLRAAVNARRLGLPWTFWLDEARIVGYIRKNAITSRSKQLDQIVTGVRKLGGNMVLIEQLPEAVPALIVAWARNTYYCHAPGVVSIDLRGPDLKWRQDIRDFPNTVLEFDTRDFAPFRTDDLNVDSMFQAIAGEPDQLQAVLDYMDRPTIRRAPGPRGRDPEGRFVPAST